MEKKTELESDLEHFRVLLDNMSEDFEAFTILWPRIQRVLYQLQEMPAKNPDKDGFLEVMFLSLTANRLKDATKWLDQEIGRKLKKLEQKEPNDLHQENALCKTDSPGSQ